MLTSEECRAKAIEMTVSADQCRANADVRGQYLMLARQWRAAAVEAARQDAHHMAEPPGLLCPGVAP